MEGERESFKREAKQTQVKLRGDGVAALIRNEKPTNFRYKVSQLNSVVSGVQLNATGTAVPLTECQRTALLDQEPLC